MQGPPGRMKPQASCTMTVAPGMVVKTQYTSEVADKAQQGVMELLLINHPLDCPVCDKGGECPLQNQAMSNGRSTSRFEDVKRTYPKPINISAQVLLDRERCVLCARCTRFSEQIAGDPFIALVERGALQQVGIYEEKPFESLLLRQHRADLPGRRPHRCRLPLPLAPVRPRVDAERLRALRERLRQRTDHRRGAVLRRMAQQRPGGQRGVELRQGPLGLRLHLGRRPPRSCRWSAATTASSRVVVAGARPSRPRPPGSRAASSAGVLVGGRVSAEDAYAYGKFARTVLGTNDIDFRARPHSAEEADFLASHVVATGAATAARSPTPTSSAPRPSCSWASSPRTRARSSSCACARRSASTSTAVYAVSPVATRGLAKMGGTLIPTAPGTEPEVLQRPRRGLRHRARRGGRAGPARRRASSSSVSASRRSPAR